MPVKMNHLGESLLPRVMNRPMNVQLIQNTASAIKEKKATTAQVKNMFKEATINPGHAYREMCQKGSGEGFLSLKSNIKPIKKALKTAGDQGTEFMNKLKSMYPETLESRTKIIMDLLNDKRTPYVKKIH